MAGLYFLSCAREFDVSANWRRPMIKHRLSVLLAIVGLAMSTVRAQDAPVELFQTISSLDSAVFEAFNQCSSAEQLEKHASYFAPDVEFYHDTGGVTWTRDQMLANTRKYVCGKFRRELIPASLKIFPIKEFGAVEQGVHQFCQFKSGDCEGKADFVMVWRNLGGAWQITRVLSYGHRAIENDSDVAQGCIPLGQRTQEIGCWILVDAPLGRLPQRPMFWHLDAYPTRVAAEGAKGSRGTVVESLGKVWLFTIEATGWRPSGGTRVAEIGPLPVRASADYSAQYMEAIFTPGMTSRSHRHSGPEAWYTLSGETCLETPGRKYVGRAGGTHVIVPGGPPMHLTATGTETRRSLVLILHDASQPATTLAHDWKPKGLCKR
jgi:quercetin dioxygenase-like cupin family protein